MILKVGHICQVPHWCCWTSFWICMTSLLFVFHIDRWVWYSHWRGEMFIKAVGISGSVLPLVGSRWEGGLLQMLFSEVVPGFGGGSSCGSFLEMQSVLHSVPLIPGHIGIWEGHSFYILHMMLWVLGRWDHACLFRAGYSMSFWGVSISPVLMIVRLIQWLCILCPVVLQIPWSL